MADNNNDAKSAAELMQAYVREHRTLFMVLGISLVFFGFIAVVFPFATTIAAKIVLGWLFIVSGIMQMWHSFATKAWSGFLFNLIIGALYVFMGAWLAFLPFTGIITLTILLAIMFIFQGALEVGMAMKMPSGSGKGWVVFSGLIAALVGFMILGKLPSSAIWAIGLLVGINMITSGFAYLAMAMAAGKND